MLLNQSLTKLKKLKGKTVGNLLSEFKSDIKEFKINKGGIGQMLLLYLGLPLDSKLTDFDDGELKTNKTDKNGNSKETIFITQISSIIDELISDNPKNFYQSNLFKKIKNVALVGICKDDKNYNNWKFTYFYNFNYKNNKELFEEFNNDYTNICEKLKQHHPVIISNFLNMDEKSSGIFFGATIHDVAQVVGAGFTVSDYTGEIATLIKLFRVTLLFPVVLHLL